MTRPLTAAAPLIALVLAGTTASAQTAQTAPAGSTDAAIDQLRKDARATKTDLVASTMGLTADEATKFWPLYKKYEEQRKAIGDEKLALIKDYAANYKNLTDEKAGELLGRLIGVEDKVAASKRQFVQELKQALPAKKVARFYQVDNRIDLLMNLELASQIPIAQ